MRVSTLVIGAAVAGLLAPVPLIGFAQADGAARRANIIAVKDIKPGMKGYGLTVFKGTQPERFDVEVIDVLDNFRPRQELILVRTRHPRLEVAKIVAGMSGSPIYLDGKMAGAYAYGWGFPKESIVGVTPIRSMLDDLARPLPKAIDGWPLRPLPSKAPRTARAPGGRHRFAGPVDRYDVEAHARQVATAVAEGGPAAPGPVQPVSTPLLMGGMTPRAIDFARELYSPLGLEPLQAGGGGGVDPAAPTEYVDGGAIGVQLIRGDMNGTAIGTVTRVEGDQLVAFGHPMMQSGVTALPTAVGKIMWFMATDMRSFKMGVPVRPLGALVQDRQASIVVSQSVQAPVVPVQVSIHGVPGDPFGNWSFEVAHEKFMTPSFVAVALGNALQTSAAERQDVSWNAKSTIRIQGHGELAIEDFGVSVGGTPSPDEFARSNLVGALGALLNNPWEPVIIESVTTTIDLRFTREILRLRGAEVAQSEVEAGKPARVRLTFVPFAGPPVTRTISVPIPRHLAGKEVSLHIAPGYSEYKDLAEPEDLAGLVRNLEQPTYPPKSVVVSFSTETGGVAYKRHVVRNLPPGALDTIRPTTSTVAPQAFTTEARHVVQLDEFVLGEDTAAISLKKVFR